MALDRANKKMLGGLGSNAGMVMKSPSGVLADIELKSRGSKLDMLAEMIVTSFRDKRPMKSPEDPDLNDVPICTSQSELGKQIIFPDWKSRPTWNHVRSHDILGNLCWVFTSMENPKQCFCEMKLRLYRHDSFDHRQ
ncbi:hypothetical protein N7456_007107 [Penicillium angulare]|uniref:Uncharacterized protein n=1 Tax=Penicillium angulare TaxID=116970 RepID=A0A9W9KC88_9EURO|nr:hypothetical protein N7456_007107 [Penicillium angulare]